MVQDQRALIKLASPDIQESDIENCVSVLKSGNLVQGVNVSTFEQKLESFAGFGHCAVVTSGTAALHLALLSLDIGLGDYVIVPDFTFPATANAVERVGAHVILCDVEEDSYVVSPEVLEELINKHSDKNIKAIIVVHEFGYPAKMATISKLAKNNSLVLIEDAACALGTISDAKHVGYYSDVACFSFHPRKAITTGEGGALLSRNESLIDRVKVLRNHGMKAINGVVGFVEAGLNYRMSDFQAALAIGQIDRFPQEIEKRKYLASIYTSMLNNNDKIILPKHKEGHSWQSYMIQLGKELDRKQIMQLLLDKGIQSNLGAQALHELSYYKQKYFLEDKTYINANRLYSHGLVLPLYGKLERKEIDYIAQTLLEILEHV